MTVAQPGSDTLTCTECDTPLTPGSKSKMCPRHLDNARKRRARLRQPAKVQLIAPRLNATVPTVAGGTASVNHGTGTGTISNVLTDRPLDLATDWAAVFERFGLDATVFEIVNDTVTMTVGDWQQSKRLDNGDRDTITLYSHRYSAAFRRRSSAALPAGIVGQWRDRLLADRHDVPFARRSDGARGAYAVLVADPQLGKKGTDQAVDNWKRGVLGHVDAVRGMVAAGRTPAAMHVAFQGDETEGVCNNYENQPHTVELNQSAQLELDYDLRVWTMRQVLALGLPTSASSVVSNHGEWTRNGGKEPVTTRNDNASTFIARQVKSLFDELWPHTGQHIDWHIGDDRPGVTLELGGIECYFSHGYVEKGKGAGSEARVKAAIERQILGSTARLGTTRLWFMAHYHHFHAQEFEGRTLFGSPALEAERSSEYMLDQFGVWSPPGMLGMLVDSATARGWSDLAIY